MRFHPSALAAAALALSFPAGAWAGPVHVVKARVATSEAPAGVVAVDPQLSADEQTSLRRALDRAGFRVAGPGEGAAQVVTVRALSRPLCTSACSVLTGYNVGPLADHFRHVAVVAARPAADAADAPTWYVVLQSDGLSDRESDYLPGMLDYGSRVFGRTTG